MSIKNKFRLVSGIVTIIISIITAIVLQYSYNNSADQDLKKVLKTADNMVVDSFDYKYSGLWMYFENKLEKGNYILYRNKEAVEYLKQKANAEVAVYDPDKLEVSSSNIFPEKPSKAAMKKLKDFQSYYADESLGNGKYYSLYKPVEQFDGKYGGYIHIAINKAPIYKRATNTRNFVLLLSLIGYLIIFLVSNFILQNIFRYLQSASKFSEEISNGNFKATINYNKYDEIGILILNLNKMAKQLDELFNGTLQKVTTCSEEFSKSAQGIQESAKIFYNTMNELVKGSESNTEDISNVATETFKVSDKADELYKTIESITQIVDTLGIYVEKIDTCKEKNISKVLSLTAQIKENMAKQLYASIELNKISHSINENTQAISKVTKEQTTSYEEMLNTLMRLRHNIDSVIDSSDEIYKYALELNEKSKFVKL